MIFTKQNISKAIEQLNFWFDKDLKVKIENAKATSVKEKAFYEEVIIDPPF